MVCLQATNAYTHAMGHNLLALRLFRALRVILARSLFSIRALCPFIMCYFLLCADFGVVVCNAGVSQDRGKPLSIVCVCVNSIQFKPRVRPFTNHVLRLVGRWMFSSVLMARLFNFICASPLLSVDPYVFFPCVLSFRIM